MVIAFVVCAVIALAFSVVAVAHRSPVVNVLSLVIVFFALAAVFAILGMDFLAGIQLIVYSGAVLVLFLFVIMLLNLERVPRLGAGRAIQAGLGTMVSVGFAVVMLSTFFKLDDAPGGVLEGSVEVGTADQIGTALLTTHLFAFEFISLILLSALVGSLVLVRKELR